MDQNNKQPITESDLDFDKKQSIGSGAFGEVFLAKVKQNNRPVAVKKVFQDRRYKNRELSIMQEVNHPNLVKLLSYYTTKAAGHSSDEFFLNCIMEYVPQTLSSLISKNKQKGIRFPKLVLKLFAYQMLKSIGYLRSIGICHRDIKPQNILVDPEDYTLKVCDFGCAKHLVKGEANIAYICSRYYRPPELILGATEYTTQVDVWSMGCVIAEVVLNRPIFPGRSAKDQLLEILKILGTPTKEQIVIMNEKCKVSTISPNLPQKPWKEVFKNKIEDDSFIDLVGKLLVYEPNMRLTPYKAMCHPFFDELRDPKTKLPNGEALPKHLFEFLECEKKCDPISVDFLSQK